MPRRKQPQLQYDARNGLGGRGEIRLICQASAPNDAMPLVRLFLDHTLVIFGALVNRMPQTPRPSTSAKASMNSKDQAENPTFSARAEVSLWLPVAPSVLNAGLRAVFDAADLVRFANQIGPGIDIADLVKQYRIFVVQKFEQLLAGTDEVVD